MIQMERPLYTLPELPNPPIEHLPKELSNGRHLTRLRPSRINPGAACLTLLDLVVFKGL